MRLTGSFELAGRVDEVLPLFTAEGERRWAPGWEPVWVEQAHVHEVGEVWTTAGPPATTWITVASEPDRVTYARVADDDSAGLVTVVCAESHGLTTVTVEYDLSSLSESGTRRLEAFAEGYDDMLRHWQHHVSLALAAE